MSWFGLLAIAVALALDAFVVAVVAGLSLKVLTKRHLFRLSFHFGLFQAAMLAAGWLIGNALYALVAAAAHWVAFALLTLVGGNVLWHAFSGPRGAHGTRPDLGLASRFAFLRHQPRRARGRALSRHDRGFHCPLGVRSRINGHGSHLVGHGVGPPGEHFVGQAG